MEEAYRRTRGHLGGWELDTVLLAAVLLIAVFDPGTLSLDQLFPLGL